MPCRCTGFAYCEAMGSIYLLYHVDVLILPTVRQWAVYIYLLLTTFANCEAVSIIVYTAY